MSPLARTLASLCASCSGTTSWLTRGRQERAQVPAELDGQFRSSRSSASTSIYLVENVVTQAHTPVHASFLAYYDDSALQVTPTLREQAAFDTYGFVVERLGDFRFNEA